MTFLQFCVFTCLHDLHVYYRYKVEDLAVARQYRVNMQLMVCFESSSDSLCIYNTDIFTNTLLPKLICDWSADYSQPGKVICFIFRFFFIPILHLCMHMRALNAGGCVIVLLLQGWASTSSLLCMVAGNNTDSDNLHVSTSPNWYTPYSALVLLSFSDFDAHNVPMYRVLPNNLIWYASHFLIGWNIASISVWMKNKSKPRPLLELLFVVTASTQSKLIGTNSSSH